MDEIAERTDGVPLFVEELTKAMLESGAQGMAALSSVPHPALSVPATTRSAPAGHEPGIRVAARNNKRSDAQ
jgi:hypothetical protein